MKTVSVIWLSFKPDTPAKGYWDHGIIESILKNELWEPVNGYEFIHSESNGEPLDRSINGAVIVLPARAQADCIAKLNKYIKSLGWVVIILTGDEEAEFPHEKIKHPNYILWVMSPHDDREYPKGTRFLGTGWPPQARELLPKCKKEAKNRQTDYYFAGQITHARREEMKHQIEVMEEFKFENHLEGKYTFTPGFTQGVEPLEYYKQMAQSKVALCPSGPETPDSFRLFEALEAGCLPMADEQTPKNNYKEGYWTWFFGEEPPFFVIKDYDSLQGYVKEAVAQYPAINNKCYAWWQKRKREMAYWVKEDINKLSKPLDHENSLNPKDTITVIIVTSPIKIHPDTSVIDETIDRIRLKLPNSEIIVCFDGVREEQKHYTKRYNQYIQKMLWKCNFEYKNVLPLVFEKHQHQAKMTREALKYVNTPTILFVEHDAPLVPDYDFEWANMVQAIVTGQANVIRFHFEAHILDEHKHLMLDSQPEEICGVPMMRTIQWSQRPHLASTAFYRDMLNIYFSKDAKTMIEDQVHGHLIEAYKRDGTMGWFSWRVWIYTPEGNIKRSYHLDARGEDSKYEDKFTK